MKTLRTFMLLLPIALSARANDIQAPTAGDVAKYDPIEDTCNHPILLSAAAFASNFFCEKVLKVAMNDLECNGLRFPVIEAQAQIVRGANFRQTVALVDEERKCVIAFHTKIYMPVPHSGMEPKVDVDELEAMTCEKVDYEDNCLQYLTMIDAYWEEEIEDGDGKVAPSTEEEWEKQTQEEEEIIETTEEDLEQEGISHIEGINSSEVSPANSDASKGGEHYFTAEPPQVNATSDYASSASSSTDGDITAAETLEVNATSMEVNTTPLATNGTALVSNATFATSNGVENVAAENLDATTSPPPTNNATFPTNASDVVSVSLTTIASPLSGAVNPPNVSDNVPNGTQVNEGLPSVAPYSSLATEEALLDEQVENGQGESNTYTETQTTTALPTTETNTELTPAEALAEQAINDVVGAATSVEQTEELVEDAKAEIEEEIEEFEEEIEAEETSGPYNTEDLDDYEDEATWAFAGKTDECSRFGVSPAEGIAFKCGTTVYICGETLTFREKFLLLLNDPIVDGCDMGEVKETLSSRGDCNFFPKNEHYLKRDGTQKAGRHLFCPNGKTLDSYYMFCTQELDNYYCDGTDCETCAGTSRRTFLRH